MIWAFIDRTYKLEKHYMDNKGRLRMTFRADGNADFEFIPILDLALLFGWLSFLAWTVLALVSIASFRYMRKWWWLNNWLHATSGTIICLETVIVGIIGTVDGYHLSFHIVLGFFVLALVAVLSMYGFYVWWYSNTAKWNSLSLRRVKNVHVYGGYFLIFIS